MAAPLKPSPEQLVQIERIRRAAANGLPKRDVQRLEKLNAYQLERLVRGQGITFQKVPKRVTVEVDPPWDREAALERAKAWLKREAALARAEIEEGSAPPYKGNGWG
jgi:hypothetical protein